MSNPRSKGAKPPVKRILVSERLNRAHAALARGLPARLPLCFMFGKHMCLAEGMSVMAYNGFKAAQYGLPDCPNCEVGEQCGLSAAWLRLHDELAMEGVNFEVVTPDTQSIEAATAEYFEKVGLEDGSTAH